MAADKFNIPTLLLSGATTTAAGSSVPGVSATKTYRARGATSAGAGAAVVVIEGCNAVNQTEADLAATSWDTIGTITLVLGTTQVGDGFTSRDRYSFVRARPSSISGTNAAVTATMSS